MKKNKKNKNENQRPKSLSTALAVAKRVIDTFVNKKVYNVFLRKSTEKRISYYAMQFECTNAELLEALAEYFCYVSMPASEENSRMHLGGQREVFVQKYSEEKDDKENDLMSFFGESVDSVEDDEQDEEPEYNEDDGFYKS